MCNSAIECQSIDRVQLIRPNLRNLRERENETKRERNCVCVCVCGLYILNLNVYIYMFVRMSVYKRSSQYGTIYETTRRHIQEECTLDAGRRVNLRSHVSILRLYIHTFSKGTK